MKFFESIKQSITLFTDVAAYLVWFVCFIKKDTGLFFDDKLVYFNTIMSPIFSGFCKIIHCLVVCFSFRYQYCICTNTVLLNLKPFTVQKSNNSLVLRYSRETVDDWLTFKRSYKAGSVRLLVVHMLNSQVVGSSTSRSDHNLGAD